MYMYSYGGSASTTTLEIRSTPSHSCYELVPKWRTNLTLCKISLATTTIGACDLQGSCLRSAYADQRLASSDRARMKQTTYSDVAVKVVKVWH